VKSRYCAVAVALTCLIGARAQAQSGNAPVLTESDRAQIQQLSARYAQTLSACAAADYAALFAPGGYFESGFRGRVEGTEKLIELVRSERHCTGAGSRPVSPVPATEIAAAAQGVTGRIKLANDAGVYEDVYVKTTDGWRFKSRAVLTAKELAARESSSPASSAR
jgi:hypothetical protein